MNRDPAPLNSNGNPARLRILIADDFPEWRNQIRRILSSRPDWEIVGEARDGHEAVQKAVELRPDFVLLDIGMPVMNGLQAAVKIRQLCTTCQIIFVTQTNDEAVLEAAMEIGALGYVLKSNAALELVGSIAAAQDEHRLAGLKTER